MSTYDAIGGAGVVKTAVSVFYQRVLDDPDLQPWFQGIDLDRLRAHQRAFIAEALGGPDLFAGRSMAQAHAGLAITDDAFDAVLEHLVIAMHDLGVAEEGLAQIRAAVESVRDHVVTVRPAPV